MSDHDHATDRSEDRQSEPSDGPPSRPDPGDPPGDRGPRTELPSSDRSVGDASTPEPDESEETLPARQSRPAQRDSPIQFSLYDARGEPIATTAGHGGSPSPVVANYFDNRVQVAVERDRERNVLKVSCVVRARRSGHGRLNTYYVRFGCDPTRNTSVVRTELHRFLTDYAGLELADPSVDQGAAVHHILTTPERPHLADSTVDHLDTALSEAVETIGITVPHEGTAVAVAFRLLDQTDATTLIVTRKADGIAQFTGTVDAALQIRDCAAVELGEATERAVEDCRTALLEARIQDHVDTIGDEITALEERTHLDAVAIRRRVKAELPSLSRSERARVWLADTVPGPVRTALGGGRWLSKWRSSPSNGAGTDSVDSSPTPAVAVSWRVYGALAAVLLAAIGLLLQTSGGPTIDALTAVDGSAVRSIAEQSIWQALVTWVQVPWIGSAVPAWTLGLPTLIAAAILLSRFR